MKSPCSHTTVAFTATIDGTNHTFIYEQVGNTPNDNNDILVDLQGVTVTNLSTLISSDVVHPVVFDLNNDGFTFVTHNDPANQARFDFNSNGQPVLSSWIGALEAFLAIDLNHDSIVNNGTELVFSDPDKGAYTDLEGIRVNYDSNMDGVLDAHDTSYSQFGLWQDANMNGISDEGEFKSLSDYGITSINLISDGNAHTAANGEVLVYGESSFTYADGSTGQIADVALTIFDGDQSDSSTNIINLSDGADTLEIPDDMSDMAQYSGGHGLDTVAFSEAGMTLTIDEIKEHFQGGFEQIDMTDHGANTIVLDYHSVISLTGDDGELGLTMDHMGDVPVLKIVGDSDDTVILHNATQIQLGSNDSGNLDDIGSSSDGGNVVDDGSAGNSASPEGGCSTLYQLSDGQGEVAYVQVTSVTGTQVDLPNVDQIVT